MIRKKNDTHAYGNAESDNDKRQKRKKKGKKNRKESNNTSYSAVSMNKITICLLTKETYLSCRALSAK